MSKTLRDEAKNNEGITWELFKKNFNPIQPTYAFILRDRSATVTTDYHKADALAHKLFGEVSLQTRRYTLDGYPVRYYASQNY